MHLGRDFMDLTQPTAAAPAKSALPALQPESSVRTDVRDRSHDSVRTDLRNAVRNDAATPSQSTGYGLPCSNCRLYYPANLDASPASNSADPVSPTLTATIPPLQ